MTFDDMKARQAEYRIFLAKWILAKDEHYNRDRPILKGTEPLRRPKGEVHRAHNRRYWWSDAVWCGDVTTGQCPEEFFGPDFTTNEFLENDEVQNWLNEQFDLVFKEVLPVELHDILEG